MSKTLYRLGLAVAFTPLVTSLVILPFLPETIPAYFMGTTPDAWSSKWSALGIITLFVLPLVSLIVYGLLRLLALALRGVPISQGRPMTSKHWGAVILFVAILFLIVHLLIIGLLLSNI
jgi:hypothetical protein